MKKDENNEEKYYIVYNSDQIDKDNREMKIFRLVAFFLIIFYFGSLFLK